MVILHCGWGLWLVPSLGFLLSLFIPFFSLSFLFSISLSLFPSYIQYLSHFLPSLSPFLCLLCLSLSPSPPSFSLTIGDYPAPRAVLTGHDHEVVCVSVCAELGLVISGAKGQCSVLSQSQANHEPVLSQSWASTEPILCQSWAIVEPISVLISALWIKNGVVQI